MESTSFKVLQSRLDNCLARKTDPSRMATGKDDGLGWSVMVFLSKTQSLMHFVGKARLTILIPGF